MKKCFLQFDLVLLALLLTGCSSDPVYIADEVDQSELWNFSAVQALNETEQQLTCNETVYYTASGSVWHTSLDCSSLSRTKEILSGTVEQATEDGMSRACKRCGD